MPFPLAHPAAVLPLKRFCPRYLSFSALVIGSLVPDLGYAFGQRTAEFAHRLLVGNFGFCLPVGLGVLGALSWARRHLGRVLPPRWEPLLRGPKAQTGSSAWAIAASLVIGAWAHLLLDSVTHPDHWMAVHLPVLQSSLVALGRHRLTVSILLYDICTFSGVVWVAMEYLGWVENLAGQGAAVSDAPVGWVWGWLLAVLTLIVVAASRGRSPSLGLAPAALLTVALVVGFVAVTAPALRRSR